MHMSLCAFSVQTQFDYLGRHHCMCPPLCSPAACVLEQGAAHRAGLEEEAGGSSGAEEKNGGERPPLAARVGVGALERE